MSATADFDIVRAMRILKKESVKWHVPVLEMIEATTKDPFRVLISCILSLRTKDETTSEASKRLYARATTPTQMLSLTEQQIQKLIYPVGFYKTKAKRIREICQHLLGRFSGQVPDDIDTLLTLPGVGRKTANLVVAVGFQKPGICVDVHVHRISNRWGYLKSKDPYDTEMQLREVLPKRYWLTYNTLLVTLGQAICKPTSPMCSQCPLTDLCARIDVGRSR